MSSLAWRLLAVQAASGSATNLFMWGDNTYGQIGATSPQYYSWSQIAAGGTHTVAVRSDGILFAWGSNSLGQLGDNTTLDRSSPVQIASTISWIAVSAGNYHTVAIDKDYTLWGWGLNNYGQLADASLINRSYPVQISGNKSWTSVNAGGYHNVALKSDGSLWTWGADTAGQLGARISYVQMVSGDSHVVALKSDGSLWTWGSNVHGQLGLADTINRSSPVQLGTGNSYSQIAAGQSTSHAIRSDGSLWSWGANTSGQLGDGTTVARSSPVQIGTSSYIQVAASVGDAASSLPATYMIDINGRLFATGIATAGALGDGTITNKSSPVQIGTGYQKVFGRYGGGFAIKSANSSLWGWGYNQTYGSLGDGTTINRSQPVQVGQLSWSMVSGSYAVYGITSLGLLFAWGRDDFGDFGFNFTGLYRSNPTQIGYSSWSQVASNFNTSGTGFFTIAVDANNNLFTWGYNAGGQLGLGNTTAHYSSPVQVGNFGTPASKGVTISAWGTYYLNSVGQLYSIGGGVGADNRSSPAQVGTFNPNFQAVLGKVGSSSYTYICAGKFDTLAITTENKLFAWGLNPYGQLGDSTTIQRSSPVQIGNSSWSAVSSGGSHTIAVRSDGALFSWGVNNYGQLGINSVATDLNWIALRDGGNHVIAIRSDGALFAWGANDSGQLGDSTTLNRSSPVQIGSNSWTSITGGASHTVAIRSDGSLWAWGFNMNGQLGIGPSTGPTPYVGWSCVAISDHTMAIRNDGTLWGWGYNLDGQIGVGAVYRSNPVQVGVSGASSGDYGLLKWKSISTGSRFTLGITEDGRCYGWGLNSSGQLGDNTVSSRTIPTPIINSGLFTKLYAGSGTGAAIDVNYKMWIWGSNGFGQLGTGDVVSRSSPVQISTSSWTMVSLINGVTHALRVDGALFSFGNNSNGQLGDGTTISRSSPIQIGTSSWTYISASTNATGAIRIDNTLWVWGRNAQGELGQNDTINRSSPVQIAGSWISVRAFEGGGTAGFLAVDTYGYLYSWGGNLVGEGGYIDSAGSSRRSSPVQIGSNWDLTKIVNLPPQAVGFPNNGAFRDNGLYVWGYNVEGQLGLGDTVNRSSPVLVPAYSNVSSPVQIGTSSWISVSAGTYHTLGVSKDKYLYGWGTQLDPMYIAFPAFLNNYWNKISVGESHVLAIKNDGTLYAWGINSVGQLGDTTTVNKSSPVLVGIGRSWSQVAAGNFHSLAISSDGKLFSWGASNNGQLSGLSWTRIASGLSHTVALRSDYTVWGWGNNQLGQIGDNTTINRSSPVQIAATGQGSAFSFTSVSAGSTHSLALRVDGTLYAWGDNSSGQLGDGTYITRSSPTQISAGVSPSSATISAVFNQYPLTNSITQNNFSLAESGATGSTFDFNTTSKTLECFFYATDFDFPQPIFSFGDWTNGVLSWVLVVNNNSIQTYYNNSSTGRSTLALQHSFATTNFSASLSVNTWYHLAIVRNTTLTHAYINGVWLASATWANYVTSGTVAFNKTWIGSYFGHPRVNFRGLINNLRFTNSIVYAASVNFTTPTGPLQLTQSANPYGGANTAAITAGQVVLLTLQTNPAVDSANSRTITSAGSPRYTGAPSPFTTYLAGTNETLVKYTQIFAGSSHSVAISSPFSRLYAWGNNSNGQLGDGTTINRSTPTQIGSETNWNLVSAGGKPDTTIQAYSVSFNGSSSWYTGTGIPTALANTYTFEAWVYYTGGAVRSVIAGNSGTASTNNFAVSINSSRQVEYGLLNIGGAGGTTSTVTVNAISASTWTHIAISVNAGAISIYINGISQTLTGTTTLTAITVQTILVIGANGGGASNSYWNGYIHGLRIISGQAMYNASFTPARIPYNYNQVGSTGAGAPASISGTVQYAGLGIGQYNYSGIALPYYYMDTYTTYYSNSSARWQLNEVGNPAYFTTGTPAVTTLNPYNIAGSTTGDGFTTAINSTTKLLTWGYNNVGQLGDSTTVSRSSPVQLGTSNWSVIASNYNASYGITTDGKLYAWGDDTSYQLGDNTTVSKSSPIQIGTSTSWSSVTASESHALAITTTGLLYGWGANSFSQVGSGNSFSLISTGLATRLDYSLWQWGKASNGVFLDNTTTVSRSSPVQIGTSSWIAISSSVNKDTIFAIKPDNTLWGWGLNTSGQLGDGTTVSRSSPVQIAGSWTKVSVKTTHVLATNITGTLWAWGLNTSGQLGDTTTVSRSSPVQISSSSWIVISAGDSTSVVIDANYRLFASGSNSLGQIGDNTTINRSSPVQIGTSSWIAVSTGGNSGGHTLAIQLNNGLYAWGRNDVGQLGLEDTINRSSPVQVGNSNWTNISVGTFHSVGITSLGRLFTWGLNSAGQLGNNTINNTSSPVQISTGISFTQVYAGGAGIPASTDTQFHTIAYSSQGYAIAFGGNKNGELGDGTTIARSNPVQIVNTAVREISLVSTSSWTYVSTGAYSSYGLDVLSNFNTWGLNTTGQLGDNTTVDKGSPTQTSTGSSASARNSPLQVGNSSWSLITAGASFSAAITTDKRLFVWGLNSSGQVGDNTTVTRSIPIQTSGSWNLVSIKSDFTIATKSNGTLWSWGNGTFGVLANNLESNMGYRSSPIQIGTSSWTQIAAGSSHVMGLINNSLYLWGSNTFGQLATITSSNSWLQVSMGSTTFGLKNGGYLYAWGSTVGVTTPSYGDGTTVSKSSPVQVSTMSFSFLGTLGGDFGSASMFAVDFSGVLYGWGYNNIGQLGDNTTIYRSSPIQIGTALNWTKIYTTNGNTIGLTSNGGLYAWGSNSVGQLGNNSTISRSSPVQIFGGGISSVCQGLSYVAIVKTDGTLWTWGLNVNGNLGSGTTINRSSPVQVGTLNIWTKVVSTLYGVVALQSNNTLWSWGQNLYGQLGQNNTTARSSPVQVPGSWTDVTAFATTVLGTSGGVVYGWGRNQLGQLGDDTTVNKSSPIVLSGTYKQLPNTDLISGIENQAGYINSAGVLFTFGSNSSGQLGDGTVISRSSPVQIDTALKTIVPSPIQLNSSSYTQISAGYSFSSALRTDGTIWAWGDNTWGQLGQNDTLSRSSPVQVGSFSFTNLYAGSVNIFGVLNDTTMVTGQGDSGKLGQFNDVLSRSSPVQMGTGKGNFYDRPVRIGLLSSWAFVNASMSTSMAIDALGRLYMWGYNGFGQLGDITTSNRSSPLQIGTNSWIIGSVSDNFTTAIRIDNTLWTWGTNSNGQLGDGTTVTKSSPVQVSGNWTDVQAGKSYSVALAQNGTIWTWGANLNGGLNNSSLLPRSSPMQVGTKIYKYIAATNNSSNAIDAYGNLFTWGDNTFGQIGNNT